MTELKLDDRFSDAHGNWRVIQIAPPHGRRRIRLITILNTDTSIAEQVEEPLLYAKENRLKMIERD